MIKQKEKPYVIYFPCCLWFLCAYQRLLGFYRIVKFFNTRDMNGIIFQDSKVYVRCSAKFLFNPDPDQRSIPAIAEFEGGEKAYAAIDEIFSNEVIIRLGEYSTGDGIKVPEKIWRLRYDKTADDWKIVEGLSPQF